MYWQMAQPGATGWLMPLVKYNFTMVQNIKRDPFEQAVAQDQKTSAGLGGALAGPATAYLYDWNMLPLGQQLALKHLQSYKQFPPLQEAAAYNLDQIMEQIRAATHPSD
jgi:arylsulfatase